MAATEAGARLTVEHSRSQSQLWAVTVRDLLRLWQMFDVEAISESWDRIEPFLVRLVQARRRVSAALSARYVSEFRDVEFGAAPRLRLVMADRVGVDDVVPNLRLVGPGNAWRLRSLGRRDVARVTFANVAGEVTRQVLNGGRETIVSTIEGDPVAVGYSRVVRGGCCAFCALLAGRGAVYRGEETAAFQAHRKCRCTPEPVYRRGAPLSESSERFRGLYRDVAGSVESGPDWARRVRAEFRRRYESDHLTPDLGGDSLMEGR